MLDLSTLNMVEGDIPSQFGDLPSIHGVFPEKFNIEQLQCYGSFVDNKITLQYIASIKNGIYSGYLMNNTFHDISHIQNHIIKLCCIYVYPHVTLNTALQYSLFEITSNNPIYIIERVDGYYFECSLKSWPYNSLIDCSVKIDKIEFHETTIMENNLLHFMINNSAIRIQR